MRPRHLVAILVFVGVATSLAAQTATNPPPNGNRSGGSQSAQGPGAMGPGGQGQHPGPPPAAIDACKGKDNGAACTFVGRQGEQLSGSCFTPPAGGPGQPAGAQGQGMASGGALPMACRPSNAPGGPGGNANQGANQRR